METAAKYPKIFKRRAMKGDLLDIKNGIKPL